MRYKITRRLIGYFSTVLLLFSATVGILFGTQFTRHTAEIYESELKNQAASMADTLSLFLQKQHSQTGSRKGFGAYLRFIDDISMGEAWLVDEHAHTIELAAPNYSLTYDELPPGAEDLIQQVFEGNVVSGRAFSSVLDVPSITAGAPVFDEGGTITGAFLLHSPINEFRDSQRHNIIIFVFCIFSALIFAFALSVFLARYFITPLREIGLAVKQVMSGDYSARVHVNQKDEIGDLARNINELFARLSDIENERIKLDKMQQDYVSNISHELRTPITVIRGSLEVLKEGLVTEPDQMQEYFQQMLSDTVHLQRLVNDLLELSRLQNSSFEIHKGDLNLTDLITDAIRSMERIAEKKNVHIHLDNQAGLVVFCGDYDRLRQMFMTILDNSIKFSPPGDAISVHVYYKGRHCVISFTDHGSGIPPQDIPHIFDRFYKKNSGDNEDGSGLGLPIAKQIADRHNIKITCESVLGKQTTFFFTLPESPFADLMNR